MAHKEHAGGAERGSGEGLADVRDPLPPEVRDPSFSASVRGYDRHAVDAYVERVNRLIAEMQVSGSPRAAVRHALDRVGEQTSGILQRARETAEEITTSAREEAEETTARAKAEAQDLLARAHREAEDGIARARGEADEIVRDARAKAEEALVRAQDESESLVARARADADGRIRRSHEEIDLLREQWAGRVQVLEADLAAIADERRALLEDVRGIATRLAEIVRDADSVEAAAVQAAVVTDAPPDGEGDDDVATYDDSTSQGSGGSER